jgi:hypothetical protein
MNEDNTIEILKDATDANPDNIETESTENIDTSTANTDIDYKKKFSESSKEALRILKENIRLANELESLRNSTTTDSNGATYSDNTEQIIPGFDMMTEDEQKNLLAYTDSIKRSTLDAIYKDPAIADAKKKYNENVWESSFNEVSTKFPKLKELKEQFKTEYFRPNQNPSNLEELMTKGAKEFLYDHVEEIAVRKAQEKADRIDTERSNGGDKIPSPERSDEDWFRLSQDNPVKFAEEYRKSQKK